MSFYLPGVLFLSLFTWFGPAQSPWHLHREAFRDAQVLTGAPSPVLL